MGAITRDGILEMPDANPSANLVEECKSASIVTGELSAEGFEPEDYHKTLNGEKFIAWMKNRLLPAFWAKYPARSKHRRKKMILILDNAKYHHARGEDWKTPSKMKKPELATFLRQAKFLSITDDDGHVYPASKFSADVRGDAGGGPPITLMRMVVGEYIKSHPGTNTTVPHQLMKDQHYELLYTPPYESWTQPIEMVWANVKHKVATQARRGRTHQEAAQQTRVALSSVSAELCQEIIRHTEDDMDAWLRSDDAGSLKRFGSLNALKAASAEDLAAVQDIAAEEGGEVEESSADKENRSSDRRRA